MSVWPVRQARPAVSVTTTPTLAPVRSATARRSARALPSGSSGSSSTLPRATLEASTPAAAMVSPSRVRTIVVGPRRATTRAPGSASSASTAARRSVPASDRPSALLTTLLVTSTTSPSTGESAASDQRRQVVAGADLGDAVRRETVSVTMTSSIAAAAIAAVASWSVM